MSPLQVAYEVVAVSGLLFHIGLVTRAWASLPATIPVHYGLSGQPDAWGGKIELLELPLLSVLVYVALTWLGRHPQKLNYPWAITKTNAEQQYRLARSLVGAIKAQLIWLLTAISWQTIGIANGQSGGLGGSLVTVILVIAGITLVIHVVLASRAK